MRLLTALIGCLLLVSASALAVNPDEVLSDPLLEERAREISKGLRCVVCQNQSIDDSDATLAKDLRLLVRERLTAGDTNDEVVSYVVSRYGDFVLLKPPFHAETLVLWLGPALMILIGLVALILFFRSNKKVTVPAQKGPAPLSETEQKQIEKLLAGDEK